MRKNKFKVLSVSIITITITIALVISFTYAWLRFYPVYNDLIISTGDYPLYITSDIYVPREKDPAVANDPNSINGLSILKNEYNYKHVTPNKDIITNIDDSSLNGAIDPSTGSITYGFNKLSHVLLGNKAASGQTAEHVKITDFIDPKNPYGIKTEKFIISYMEFKFVKEYFQAYVYGKYKLTIDESSFSGSQDFKSFLTSDPNKNGFDNLIRVGYKVFSNDINNGKDLYRISNQDKTPEANILTTNTINTLKDSKVSNNHLVLNNVERPIFNKGLNQPGCDLLVRPNANKVNGEPCYAKSLCVVLMLNPSIIFDYLRSENRKASSLDFSFTLTASFTISDTQISKEGVVE